MTEVVTWEKITATLLTLSRWVTEVSATGVGAAKAPRVLKARRAMLAMDLNECMLRKECEVDTRGGIRKLAR